MTDFEREDMELAEMMGEHFIDATKGEEPAAMPEYKPEPVKPTNNTTAKEKPCNTLWEPVKPAPNSMDKLKATAKDTCVFGAISMIMF